MYFNQLIHRVFFFWHHVCSNEYCLLRYIIFNCSTVFLYYLSLCFGGVFLFFSFSFFFFKETVNGKYCAQGSPFLQQGFSNEFLVQALVFRWLWINVNLF